MTPDTSELVVPNTRNEIFEFICENRNVILTNWNLLFEIIQKLDTLLCRAKSLSDLHSDTKVILEAIKIQHDALLKEFKNDITFEKILFLADRDELDSFFEAEKRNSLTVQFLDQLNFGFQPRQASDLRPARISYRAETEDVQKPEEQQISEAESNRTNAAAQEIMDAVLNSGGCVEYFKLICDKSSYSKTVLNAFNLALALRQKLVSIKTFDTVLHVTSYEPGDSSLDHSILSITPEQFNKIKTSI